MTNSVKKQKKMILPLESMRGIAALLVALCHYQIGSLLTNNPLVDNAYMMVDLFFVLSGFVMALTYLGRLHSRQDLWRFQKKRFWRLYPLHFAMLWVFVGVEFAKYVFETMTGIASNEAAFSVSDLPAFLHNIFLTHGFFYKELVFNGPSWSISIEFYTYLVFALVTMLCAGMLGFVALSCVLVALSLGVQWVYFDELAVNVLNAVRCIYCFFIGALCCLLYQRYQVSQVVIRWANVSLLPLVVIGLLMVCHIPTASGWCELLVPFVFGLWVFCLAVSDGTPLLYRVLCQKWLVYLGTISYSVYMVHSIVWWVINQALRFVVKADTKIAPDGKTVLDLTQFESTLVIFFGLVLILFLSALSYRWIEDRYRLRGRG